MLCALCLDKALRKGRGRKGRGGKGGERPSSVLWWKTLLLVLLLPVPSSPGDLPLSLSPLSAHLLVLPLIPFFNNHPSWHSLGVDCVAGTALSVFRLVPHWVHLLTKLTNKGHPLPQCRRLERFGTSWLPIGTSRSLYQHVLLIKPAHPLMSNLHTLIRLCCLPAHRIPSNPNLPPDCAHQITHEVHPHTLPCSHLFTSRLITYQLTVLRSPQHFSQPEVRPHLDLVILQGCSDPEISGSWFSDILYNDPAFIFPIHPLIGAHSLISWYFSI